LRFYIFLKNEEKHMKNLTITWQICKE